MRPRSRAAPRRSVRSSTAPRARVRPVWGGPGRRPAPSAPGTGARARRSWSCRDQRVVAGQRSKLDLDVGAAAARAAQLVELGLVGRVGEGQMAREAAAMAAGELAG